MEKITTIQIEEALSKLLFNITASIKDKHYQEYKELFESMLNIVNKWIDYYVEDKNLLRITDKEVDDINNYMNKIPFEAYNGDYYEEVDTWLTVVIYYGSCPVNIDFDESKIVRKGSI